MADMFTKEQKAQINKALDSIAAVKKEMAKAKLANIDVSDYERRLLEAEQGLLALKRVYFLPQS